MFRLLSQFVLQSAIRNPLYILNPPVVTQDAVKLPRFTVLHYLDTKSPNHFPDRSHYYFSEVPGNKKIPIHHVGELLFQDEVATQLNKMAPNEIRKWNMANMKAFRPSNLLEVPNRDSSTVSVFNYNLLNDMYRYKSSALTRHYKFVNLRKTVWETVKKGLMADPESIHFVAVDVPVTIPNYRIIDMMLKFNTIKLTRVVTDDDLMVIIDIYRWLLDDHRRNSTMLNISDEDSNRVMLEFKFKGFSTFLPLHVLRSISDESQLENKTKVRPEKVARLFVMMLYKLQDKVNVTLEGTEVLQDVMNGNNESRNSPVEFDEDDAEVMNKPEQGDDTDILDSLPQEGIVKVKSANPRSAVNDAKSLHQLDELTDAKLETHSVDKLLESAIMTFDNDNTEADTIYEETISKMMSEGEEAAETFTVDYSDEAKQKLLQPKTADGQFEKFIEDAVKLKTHTSGEIRSLKKVKEARAGMKSPYDPKVKIDEAVVIDSKEKALPKEEIAIKVDNPLVSDDLKTDIITNFERKYVKETYRKDVIASVLNLERSGAVIKEYVVEENRSSLGVYEVHKLTIKPLNGKESTILFRLPKIDEEGTFRSGNIIYRLRKQRTELPIRKISPIKVALTSNYSKLFVARTERKTNDQFAYLLDFIRINYLNGEGVVTKLVPGVKLINNEHLPNIYHLLSSNFNEVHTTAAVFLLKREDAEQRLDKEVAKKIGASKHVFCGYLPNKHIMVVGYDDVFYDYTNNMTPIGKIEDLLGIDKDKVPKPFSTMKVLGDDIPLGVALSYYIGLSGLLAITDTKFQVVPSGTRISAQENELILKFSDFKLVLTVDTIAKQLLFNGFLFYKNFTKDYNLADFNYKEIYLNLLEFRDAGLIHIKELNLLEELFLDPITVDVLKSIGEPTDFLPLLLKANLLLEDMHHPDPNDPNYSRIRGYDRVPGLMYKALAESIREFKIRGRANSKIELDPYKVWNAITQDSTVKITEDVNPILNARESEIVTLTGSDGLSKDATPKMLRRYHKNDAGLISEGTVESGDVALNIYLSPYAKLNDVRGTVNADSKEHELNKAKVFSTSVMLAPGSEYDDPKRMNFAQVQNGHTIGSAGYAQSPLRTGYEYVMPYKVGKMYCAIAKQDGEVIDKSDKLLTVKYKDGTVESIQIGTIYGRMEGSVYPHNLITDLAKGSKFKASGYLAYNQNFFEKDWLDPTKLVMKFGRTVSVALSMNNEVFEDSSAISKKLSDEMATVVMKEKIYVIEFSKNILNLVPEGTMVEPSTVLFSAVDMDTDHSNLSESTITMLQNLSSLSPRAKYNGVIDRYEIKYNGDISDMSPTVKKLAMRLDRQLYDETKGTEYEASNNRVNSEYRSEGRNLTIDTFELKIFIKVELKQNIGSKGVFATQMKSVIADVYTYNVRTESGKEVEAFFSFRGCLNRQVISPVLIGTTIRLTKHVSKMAAEVYFGK